MLLLVFGEEGLAARQLLGRRAFPERKRALGERTEALTVGVRHDARRAVEHRVDAELVHLRADAHAQYEIRVYAEAMLQTLRAWVPMTYDAFVDYRMGGAHLSGKMLAVIRRLVAGEAVAQDASGLSKREWTELMTLLGR